MAQNEIYRARFWVNSEIKEKERAMHYKNDGKTKLGNKTKALIKSQHFMVKMDIIVYIRLK